MQAANDRLLEGAPVTPYEILQSVYSVKGNRTLEQIKGHVPQANDDWIARLTQVGFLQETIGADQTWRVYRITRSGRMVATAYTSGLAQAFRLHAHFSGADRVPAFRKKNAWLFAHAQTIPEGKRALP